MLAVLLLIVLAGCSTAPAQPLSFNPAPWSDGEVSTYDLKDHNAAPIGAVAWIWRAGPGDGEWAQGYELNISGRS